MKTSEVKLLSIGEIETKMTDARQELMNLRFQVITGQLTDTSRLKKTRRQIAVFETVMNELHLAEKEGKK
jgi:large subunit ribosomal protein L29